MAARRGRERFVMVFGPARQVSGAAADRTDRRGPDRLRGIKLDQVRYVVTAAEERSFRRAAAVLRVEQSTISRCVRDLEHQLGAALFERSAGGVRLTTIGEGFLAHARVGMEHLEGAAGVARALGAAEAGRLRLGVSAPAADGRLAEWLRWAIEIARPLEVRVFEASPGELRRALELQALDLACLVGGAAPEPFRSQTLWREPMVVVAPRGHALASRRVVEWTDLAQTPLILARDHPAAVAAIMRSRSEQGLVAPRREPVGLAMLLRLVGWGQGLTVLPASLASARAGETVAVALRDEGLDVIALWSPRNVKPGLARFLRRLARAGAQAIS